MNLLLVEDEPRVAAFMTKGLRANGHTVHWCSAGRPALDALSSGDRWDLVILDLGLPDIDGLEVLQHVRDRQIATPVIIVTARQDDESRTRASELGVRGFLMKPFTFSDLLSNLDDQPQACRADGER